MILGNSTFYLLQGDDKLSNKEWAKTKTAFKKAEHSRWQPPKSRPIELSHVLVGNTSAHGLNYNIFDPEESGKTSHCFHKNIYNC